MSLRAVSRNFCCGWTHWCYRWPKWKAKGGTINFCEMLQVNLLLLLLLKNLMTALIYSFMKKCKVKKKFCAGWWEGLYINIHSYQRPFFSWKKPTLWFYIPFVSYKSSWSLCPKQGSKKKLGKLLHSLILLAQGKMLIILLEDNLPGPFPIGQVIFKRYLPSKKIY